MHRPIAGLVLATAAACGGGSAEGQVRDKAKEYYAAVAEGDGGKACELLTRRAQAQLGGPKGACVKTVQASDLGEDLKTAELVDIRVKARKATAVVEFDGQREDDKLAFEKLGPNWVISDTGDTGR